jgi:hypothetical protein
MEWIIFAVVVGGIWWFFTKGTKKSPGAAIGWVKDKLVHKEHH